MSSICLAAAPEYGCNRTSSGIIHKYTRYMYCGGRSNTITGVSVVVCVFSSSEMSDVPPEPPKVCDNCHEIIDNNYALHVARCRRSFVFCELCKTKVAIAEMTAHKSSVNCSLCNRPFPSCQVKNHEVVCPEKSTPCQYCKMPVLLYQVLDHERACGSRTEPCELCGQRIMLSEMQRHRCHQPSAGSGRSSATINSIAAAQRAVDALRKSYVNDAISCEHCHSPFNTYEELLAHIAVCRLDPGAGGAPVRNRSSANRSPNDRIVDDDFDEIDRLVDMIHNTTTSPPQTPPRPRPQQTPGARPAPAPVQMDDDILAHHMQETDIPCIPCEFCDEMLPLDHLELHQLLCERNPSRITDAAPSQSF